MSNQLRGQKLGRGTVVSMNGNITSGIPLLSKMSTMYVNQFFSSDLSQPQEERQRRIGEILIQSTSRFEKGFLHDIRRVNSSPQPVISRTRTIRSKRPL